ncbi:MAG: hypothetical protein E7294_03220 [Lachnospiraceae bacterium]|nr:hypothetical protein [Lachnospiraceae bacterium]
MNQNQTSPQKRIKWCLDVAFVLVFLCMIFVPFLKLDTAETIDSTLENRSMTKWPGLDLKGEHNEWYGHYVEDRVAFREKAIRFYIKGTYALFHEFSEDLHMYGKDGWIFPADDAYVKAYQHLNTDEALLDNLTTYLSRTNDYLNSRGITFVFTMGLDKKAVYGQYFPDSIHVDETKKGIPEMLSEKLTQAGVPYVIPVKEFQKKAKTEQIYNKSYDCAHWNDLGALYGMQLVDDVIRKDHPELPALLKEDFTITYESKGIEFIELPIKDSVPVCEVNREQHLGARTKKVGRLTTVPGTSMQDYINPDAVCKTKILVIHDSFLEERYKFLTYRYKEVFMVPRQNYTHLQEYVEALKPDVVLFECAQRAFVDDLYAYTELADVTYGE